jgi:hypothetical protein
MGIEINHISKEQRGDLQVYNAQAVIDRVFEFYYENPDTGDITDYDFVDYSTAWFRVYDERQGDEIKDITLSRSSNDLIMNASVSDMTFEDLGKYYFEIGYTKSGGYDEVLRYGTLYVI